ncbi:UNVERIFIED_CONTAM: hypothetical protein RMT77_012350 [Armadillidium vulgare]
MKRIKFILLASVAAVISFFASDAVQMRSYRLNRSLRYKKHYHSLTPEMANSFYQNKSIVADDFRNPDTKQYSNLSYEIDSQLERESEGNETKVKKRGKRATFAWPPDTIFIAQFSLEIPIYSPEGVDIPLLLEVPYELDLPNVTESIITPRKGDDRRTFFGTMEALFNRFGFHGESCMLRAICERAETNVLTKGLLGEVLNLVLAVSSSNEDDSAYMEHYKEAEFHGRTHGDCDIKYSECPVSIFHFFD